MLYRLNYNGQQVSGTFATKKAAYRALTEQAEYSARIGQSTGRVKVQFQDPDTGEWFDCGIQR